MPLPPDSLVRQALNLRPEMKLLRLTFQKQSEEFDLEKSRLQKLLSKGLKKAQAKANTLQDKLACCLEWAKLHHEGLLLQSHLYLWKKGMEKLEVQDWEEGGKLRAVDLTPPLTIQEEIAKRFKQCKKLRLGIPHTQRQLDKTQHLIGALEGFINDLNSLDDPLQFNSLLQILFPAPPKLKASSPLAPATSPYRQYWSESGLAILVGKKAKDNDTLTFKLARGSDWWLHVSGFSGSHVVLKAKKNQEPDPEALQDAMQLAVYYSQAKKLARAEVIVSQPKYLSRLGKSTKVLGKVQISKFKAVLIDLDLSRIESIKMRTKAH